jgi:hypothetical protein
MAANKKAPITVALQNEGSPYDGHSGRSYLRSRKPLNAATGTDPLQVFVAAWKWKAVSVFMPFRITSLTSPRPGWSFSDGPSSSRNTFLPW